MVDHKRIQEVYDSILGTPYALEDHTLKRERDDPQFMRVLDDRLFNCQMCKFWCNDHERSALDGSVCDECMDEEE